MVFKSRTATLSLLGVLFAAWVVAPTASAQTTNLNLDLSGNLASLIPESQPGQLKATVTYSYSNPAQVTTTAVASSLTITFTPNCPPSILVTGPTTKVLALQPQGQTTGGGGGSVEATFLVTATRERSEERRVGK